MRYLLDVNVLIALAWPSHVHHAIAHEWFKKRGARGWASCPMTQSGFIRISSNPSVIRDAVAPQDAVSLLREMLQQGSHQFWPDNLPWSSAQIPTDSLFGHRQVADAYLLGLARRRRGKVATLDEGMAALLPAGDERNLLEWVDGG